MIFTTQGFGAQQTDDLVAITGHLSGFPSRKMFLKIVVCRVPLGQKATRSEKNDSFFRNPFQTSHHLHAIGLDQMLNHIQGDAGVELFGLKIPVEFLHVAVNYFVVGFEFPGLLHCGFVSLESDKAWNA